MIRTAVFRIPGQATGSALSHRWKEQLEASSSTGAEQDRALAGVLAARGDSRQTKVLRVSAGHCLLCRAFSDLWQRGLHPGIHVMCTCDLGLLTSRLRTLKLYAFETT